MYRDRKSPKIPLNGAPPVLNHETMCCSLLRARSLLVVSCVPAGIHRYSQIRAYCTRDLVYHFEPGNREHHDLAACLGLSLLSLIMR